MVGGKPNFLEKGGHYHFNADSGLFSIKKKGMRKQMMWNGQHLRKEQEVCKTEVKLTKLQDFFSELGGNYNSVTALECRN